MEPSRGHHLEGLPSARYAVSKTAGSRDLGGSTPSPSASGGMAELERQRVASAQAAHVVRRFESCCLRQRPVAQRSRAVGFEPTCARSIRAGASISLRRRSTVGRPVVTRRMLVRPQPSQPRSASCPDRLAVEDAGLSHRKRGFDSRSGYCVTARPRTRLETRPGCLPGETGSTPVEGVLSRRSSVVSTTLLPWGYGGSNPPGETASHG